MTRIFSRLSRFLLLGSFFIPVPLMALDLSKPLAGDWRCGGSAPCELRQLFPELKDIYIYSLIVVGLIALLAGFYAIYKIATANDQAAEINKGKSQLTRSLVGLVALAFFGTIMYTAFETLVKPQFNYVDDALSRVMEVEVLAIPHAHAQPAGNEDEHLPNALKVDSIYDGFVLILQIAMRWIGIPILIASWVWSGFLFVYARGNPEGLKRAKSRLFNTVVLTLIFMVALGIFYAFKGTFNQIFT